MKKVSNSKSNVGRVQSLRKQTLLVAISAGIAASLVGQSRWPPGHAMHEAIEWFGMVLIVMCIIGRTWCSLYIAGRKNVSLVTRGPYSVTRNPLYLFSTIGAAGIGAQFGSIVVTCVAALVSLVIFFVVIRHEERLLKSVHGARYEKYRARVPLFFPRPWLWKDVDRLQISPPRIVATFLDASLFLLSVPISEMIEYLQADGLLPVRFLLL